MSVTDVTSRIAQLQSQLAMLQTPAGTAATGFSSALDDATAATSATSAASTTTGSTTGEAVVGEARKYLGIPYVWGGTNPKTGLDCSGLTQLVFKNLGYDIPRVSYQQATAGTKVDSLAQAKPGDLLAFGSPVHHVAIYIGDNKMIEAPRPGKDVRVSEVYETPTHIRRIIDPSAASATSATTAAGGPVSADVPYARLFNTAASKYGVSATLLSAVAKQESGYNASAVSGAGARGLMQLMPGTARGLGVKDSFDPAQSVDGAARMLKGLIDTFGRTDLALAAYNAGPGAVKRYHGIPPYPETQHYVRNVLALAKAA